MSGQLRTATPDLGYPDCRNRLKMANIPTTIYANIINFRLTPGEFVLEFGAHFPDRPGQGPPSDFRPDIRVCLLYTSDAADDLLCVDLGGRRIIKKKKKKKKKNSIQTNKY